MSDPIPFPAAAAPSTFSPILWGGNACDQMRKLLATNERLNLLFSWMFNEDGTLTNDFMGTMKKWEYGTLDCSGDSGAYVIASAPPWSTVSTALTACRVVFFKASSASPVSGGCTLKLDDIAIAPLKDLFGNTIQEGQILEDQLVGAISDGTNWLVFTPLSQSKVYVIPSRNYQQTSATGGAVADFPLTLQLTFTKSTTAKWNGIDLQVEGKFMSSDGMTMECAMKFLDGPAAGVDVTSAATGAGNLSQKGYGDADNDGTSHTWRHMFEMPSSYDAINTVTFTAVITTSSAPGGPAYGFNPVFSATTQAFFGVANLLSPLA